ncbi:hypothetical protein [Lonepinella sp. BR2357]|uniref:hypothetical protein n=1 Tax=Lonepinella sp. BR2357 TaxID=3434549 RepID=UPI003F6DDAD9
MEKFKKFIEAFMQSDTFKKLLEKIKGIFSPFVQKIQQSEKMNNLLSKMLSWVSQHKLVSSVVACVVVAPTFIGGTMDMPKACNKMVIELDPLMDHGGRHMSAHRTWHSSLLQLIEEEDPAHSLAKHGEHSIYHRIYDYSVLNKLFQSKYEKLAKVSRSSADNFVESVRDDCKR